MQNLEDMVLDENEEALAPAVVVATVALLAVFVVGILVSVVGLVA
jgi:flagellar biosynthesis protein FliQ